MSDLPVAARNPDGPILNGLNFPLGYAGAALTRLFSKILAWMATQLVSKTLSTAFMWMPKLRARGLDPTLAAKLVFFFGGDTFVESTYTFRIHNSTPCRSGRISGV